MRRSLFLMFFLVAAVVAISLSANVNSYGATNKAATLPPVPLVGRIGFSPGISPRAGYTIGNYLRFYLSKTVHRLSVKYIVPAAVTKVTAKPKPTAWVNGNPVWKYKTMCGCARPRIELSDTYADDLKTGQKVKHKFVFSARGYHSVTRSIVQTVNNS